MSLDCSAQPGTLSCAYIMSSSKSLPLYTSRSYVVRGKTFLSELRPTRAECARRCSAFTVLNSVQGIHGANMVTWGSSIAEQCSGIWVGEHHSHPHT